MQRSHPNVPGSTTLHLLHRATTAARLSAPRSPPRSLPYAALATTPVTLLEPSLSSEHHLSPVPQPPYALTLQWLLRRPLPGLAWQRLSWCWRVWLAAGVSLMSQQPRPAPTPGSQSGLPLSGGLRERAPTYPHPVTPHTQYRLAAPVPQMPDTRRRLHCHRVSLAILYPRINTHTRITSLMPDPGVAIARRYALGLHPIAVTMFFWFGYACSGVG